MTHFYLQCSLYNWRFLSQASPGLAIRTRLALRAKCRVRLAWLIERLLCRLISTDHLNQAQSRRYEIH